MGARQQTWPRMWLMTDERLGDQLWDAIDRLPEGAAGILFRHYSLAWKPGSQLGKRCANRCSPRPDAGSGRRCQIWPLGLART